MFVCVSLPLSVDSAPSQGVYYFLSLSLSVCLSVYMYVCHGKLQIASFLFVDGIEPFLGRQFSMWHPTKLFSSILDLCPINPKIYSPKFALEDRLEMFEQGVFGDSRFNGTMYNVVGRPLFLWQGNLGKFGILFEKKSPIIRLVCHIDWIIMFGPTRGEDQGADLWCHGNDICARRGV